MHNSPRINKTLLRAQEKLVLTFTSTDFLAQLWKRRRRQKHGSEGNKLKFKRSE